MHKKYHLDDQPIPEGYQIYNERCSVPIISERLEDAAAFCEGSGKQWLEFQPDQYNRHDPNAIIIWGCWNGWLGARTKKIGYIDREIAGWIAAIGLAHVVRPRLLKTYVSDSGYVEIEYQILGPKDRFRDYRALQGAVGLPRDF